MLLVKSLKLATSTVQTALSNQKRTTDWKIAYLAAAGTGVAIDAVASACATVGLVTYYQLWAQQPAYPAPREDCFGACGSQS